MDFLRVMWKIFREFVWLSFTKTSKRLDRPSHGATTVVGFILTLDVACLIFDTLQTAVEVAASVVGLMLIGRELYDRFKNVGVRDYEFGDLIFGYGGIVFVIASMALWLWKVGATWVY